jgi:hypothetical protein
MSNSFSPILLPSVGNPPLLWLDLSLSLSTFSFCRSWLPCLLSCFLPSFSVSSTKAITISAMQEKSEESLRALIKHTTTLQKLGILLASLEKVFRGLFLRLRLSKPRANLEQQTQTPDTSTHRHTHNTTKHTYTINCSAFCSCCCHCWCYCCVVFFFVARMARLRELSPHHCEGDSRGRRLTRPSLAPKRSHCEDITAPRAGRVHYLVASKQAVRESMILFDINRGAFCHACATCPSLRSRTLVRVLAMARTALPLERTASKDPLLPERVQCTHAARVERTASKDPLLPERVQCTHAARVERTAAKDPLLPERVQCTHAARVLVWVQPSRAVPNSFVHIQFLFSLPALMSAT